MDTSQAVVNLSTSSPSREKCISVGLCTHNLEEKSTVSNVRVKWKNTSINCICITNFLMLFSGTWYLDGRWGGKTSASWDKAGDEQMGKWNNHCKNSQFHVKYQRGDSSMLFQSHSCQQLQTPCKLLLDTAQGDRETSHFPSDSPSLLSWTLQSLAQGEGTEQTIYDRSQ